MSVLGNWVEMEDGLPVKEGMQSMVDVADVVLDAASIPQDSAGLLQRCLAVPDNSEELMQARADHCSALDRQEHTATTGLLTWSAHWLQPHILGGSLALQSSEWRCPVLKLLIALPSPVSQHKLSSTDSLSLNTFSTQCEICRSCYKIVS